MIAFVKKSVEDSKLWATNCLRLILLLGAQEALAQGEYVLAFDSDTLTLFPEIDGVTFAQMSDVQIENTDLHIDEFDTSNIDFGSYDKCRVAKENDGKPIVVGVEGVYVSLSHSADYSVVAFASVDIGADIETRSVFDYSHIVENCFSPSERRAAEDINGFFEIWCKKEAIAKATGTPLWQVLKNNETYDTCTPFHIRNLHFRTINTSVFTLVFAVLQND